LDDRGEGSLNVFLNHPQKEYDMAMTDPIFVIMLDHHVHANLTQWPITFQGDLQGAQAQTFYNDNDLVMLVRREWERTFKEKISLDNVKNGESSPGAIFELRARA
jgi:hypothetical protein